MKKLVFYFGVGYTLCNLANLQYTERDLFLTYFPTEYLVLVERSRSSKKTEEGKEAVRRLLEKGRLQGSLSTMELLSLN